MGTIRTTVSMDLLKEERAIAAGVVVSVDRQVRTLHLEKLYEGNGKGKGKGNLFTFSRFVSRDFDTLT